MAGYAAIVLAGGAGRRLGAADKPELVVGGRPLLHVVLDAVADAAPRIVVGPPRTLPAGVLGTREHPPGGGPVAALAAGLSLVPAATGEVALLAADLPFLTPAAVTALREALAVAAPPDATPGSATAPGPGAAERGSASEPDAVVFTDGERRQLLCAAWRTEPLRKRMAALGEPTGLALRQLYTGVAVTEITSHDHPPPWYDCDTEADLRRAKAWCEGDS